MKEFAKREIYFTFVKLNERCNKMIEEMQKSYKTPKSTEMGLIELHDLEKHNRDQIVEPWDATNESLKKNPSGKFRPISGKRPSSSKRPISTKSKKKEDQNSSDDEIPDSLAAKFMEAVKGTIINSILKDRQRTKQKYAEIN